MSPNAKDGTKPAARTSARAAADDDESLKRLPGTGWQTRDGRFTITTASGTWSVTDEEQTDELGLPLVRGPYRSLTDAKAAIEAARESGPVASTLQRPAERPKSPVTEDAKPAKPEARPRPKPQEPDEPRWITELEPGDRRRARQLIRGLEERRVRDPEGVVRRDVAGGVPTVVRIAVADALAEAFGSEPSPAEVRLASRLLSILGEGRDDGLDVRWKLVDDDGRPVGLSADDVTAARKRASGRG